MPRPSPVLLLLVLLTSIGTTAEAQSLGRVMGRVMDDQTLQPIATAQVFIEGTSLGALTGADGRYTLLNVPTGTHTVSVQLIGFRSATANVTVTADQAVVLDFELVREALALDEVIVTGTAGGTQRRAIGNVVERVDVASLSEVAPAVNIEQMMGARVPGMMLLSGGPGVGQDAGAIRIRGSASAALPNDPIIYVDGIRINSEAQFAGTSSAMSRLNDINPADIESIEVIKGPAAATLYGTEASNGVIQIITKRGVTGTATFDVSAETGASWFDDPEGRIPINYGTHPVTGELIQQNLYRTESERLGHDLFQAGPIHRLGLSTRGGSDLIRYYVSGNYSYREGLMDWAYDKSASGRMSLSVNATEDLLLTVNGAYNNGSTRPYNPWPGMVQGRPNAYEPLTGIPDPRWGWQTRPSEADRDGQEDVTGVDRTSFGVEARHELFGWLTNRIVGGADLTDQTRDVITYRDPEGTGRFFGEAGMLGRRTTDKVETRLYTLDYSGTARLPVFGALTSATSWGLQYYNKQELSTMARGDNFATKALTTVGAAAVSFGDGDFEENTTVGAFIQEQVDWDERIFVTAAVRADDNSAFGTDYDLAIYPKLSATWVLHEEAFWANVPFLEQLRLRGAWGAAGRQPDAFAATRLYETRTGTGDEPVVFPNAFGNPDLGPERGEELEVGFDAGAMQDRVSLTFTSYWKKTKDAIVAKPLSPSIGFPGVQLINVGLISNWGTETQLDLQLVSREPVSWNVALGYATMHNRIDDMGELEIIPVRRAASHVRGYPLSSLFAYKVLSADFVNGNSGPVTNLICDGGTGADGRRMGGAPVPCSQAPLVYFATGEPTWSVNLASTVTLGQSWRLYALIDARGGHRVSNDEVNGVHTTYSNTLASIEQTDPIYMAYRQLRRDPISYHDGAFAKLREVSLSYTLPEAWAGAFGASRASVTGAGRNLAVLWQKQKWMDHGGMRVLDPEVGFMPQFGFSGETRSGPSLMQASLKVDVTF